MVKYITTAYGTGCYNIIISIDMYMYLSGEPVSISSSSISTVLAVSCLFAGFAGGATSMSHLSHKL